MRSATLLLLLASGCSFAFVKPPPRPDCTRSRTAPTVDVVLALTAVTIATIAAVGPGRRGGCDDPRAICLDLNFDELRAPVAAIYFGLGALAVGSAVYGFSQTAKCAP